MSAITIAIINQERGTGGKNDERHQSVGRSWPRKGYRVLADLDPSAHATHGNGD